jgi:outer membrane cobalamin receptor
MEVVFLNGVATMRSCVTYEGLMSCVRYRISAVLIAATVIAWPSRSVAQTPASQTPDELSRFSTDVVVTPERGDTPRSLTPAASVIDQRTLAALPIVHTAEVTSFLPGFVVARPEFYAGHPIVSSRGFFGGGEADYVLLLIDGIRVGDVESGLVDWSTVPISSIRRVEASRGPAASLYGDASLGGVIQILTDRQASSGQATLTGGSFGSVIADATYGRHGPGAGFTVSGAARRTDGAFAHAAGNQIMGTGSTDGTMGGYTWHWSVAGDRRNRDDPGALTTTQLAVAPYASDPMFRFDTLNRNDFSTAFTLRNASKIWQPQARVYISTRDEDLIRTIPIVPGFGDRRARTLATLALGGSIEGEHTFSGNRPIIRFGVDFARERLDTSYRTVTDEGVITTLDSTAAGHRLRAGTFVFSSWEPLSRLRVSGATRWDAVDDSGFGATPLPRRAWSPRAGVSLRLTDTGSYALVANVSRAFKAPTLDQLFDPRPFPDFRGGTFTISNPNLVPQRATNVEVGMSGAGRHVRWSALAYRMTLEDQLHFDVRTFSYTNLGHSRHTGLELEAEGRWSHLRPTIAYTLSRVVELPAQEQLQNIPQHLVSAGAKVDFPRATSVLLRYTRAWGAFLDDRDLYPLDGRSTVDLRARRPIGRHAVFVDLLNVTGRVYGEYGFTLTDFQGRVVPYVYPGAPRAIRVGVTVAL